MPGLHDLAGRLPLALAYFVAATLGAALTRFEGGVAFLWVAGAFLIADLMSRPRRRWAASIVACALASVLATGLFGLGWAFALPFAVINMAEAVIAAWLLRRLGHPHQPLGSLGWLARFVAAAGLVAPAVAAVMASAVLAIAGHDPLGVFVAFGTGHALGNITIVPLALLVARGTIGRTPRAVRRRFIRQGAVLFSLVAVTSVAAFANRDLPLLFLPVLAVILVTSRLGRGGAAAAVVLLATVGAVATLLGSGPLRADPASSASVMQFFQFYLATTVLTVLPVAADLERRQRLHQADRLSEARFRLLAEHSTDILIHFSSDGVIRYVSPAIERLGGHEPADLVGRDSSTLVHPDHVDRVRSNYLATIAAAGETRTFDYLAATVDGSTRWFETHSRAIVDEDGTVEGVLSVVRDISRRKGVELQLAKHAMTDALTGLPNRRAYRLAVERRRASPGDCVAIIDIDHFKVVNDSFGHAAGDEILRGFARIARRTLREGDLIARIGGEEFAILFPDARIDQALATCERLRLEVAASALLPAVPQVRVTVSGGVAPLGPDGLDAALAVADRALYRAKREGRDRLALAA